MAQTDTGEGLAVPQETSVAPILDKVRRIYVTHPAAKGKTLIVATPAADMPMKTDTGLVIRILMNMVTNALEASLPGEKVRLWAVASEHDVTFMAWNRQAIPPDVALRVFQRYFSTKPGPGRGLGTYTMKWLAEKYLKGRIDFVSTEADGTTFRLHLPARL
jgi:signal transduction histidine kinase